MIDSDALLRHGDFVRRLARSLVADADLAEDVAQETWLAALRRPPRRRDNLRGWLAAVTRNRARMQRRGDVRRLARERLRARPRVPADPGEVVSRLEWEHRIVEAVRELDEPYRSTIVYRFFEQLDPAAIARRTGVKRKTVYTRIQRALDILRERFDGDAGSRRAWCLALLPLALDRNTMAAAAATVAGGIAMTKTGVAVTAVLVATASFFAGWTTRPERAAPPRRATAEAPAPARPAAPETTEAAPPPERDPGAAAGEDGVALFLRRVHLAPASWYGVYGIAMEITALPPDEGLAVMRTVFAEVESPEKRRQMLKAFTIDDGHPHSLAILHLGATDPDAGVREFAFDYLEDFAFRDFREDPDGYAAWYAANGDRPLRDVVREAAASFVQRVTSLTGPELGTMLRTFEVLTLAGNERCNALELPALMRKAGLLDVATAWLARERLSPGERGIVHAWIRELDPDQAYLRRVYLPALEDPAASGDDFYAAARALGRERHRWAVEPLVAAYGRASTLGHYAAISAALESIGDRRAIPAMIAAIAADDTEASIRGVGVPLSRLVDEDYNEWQDGAWWLRWWRENRHRYPDLRLPALARNAGTKRR